MMKGIRDKSESMTAWVTKEGRFRFVTSAAVKGVFDFALAGSADFEAADCGRLVVDLLEGLTRLSFAVPVAAEAASVCEWSASGANPKAINKANAKSKVL